MLDTAGTLANNCWPCYQQPGYAFQQHTSGTKPKLQTAHSVTGAELAHAAVAAHLLLCFLAGITTMWAAQG